jgi:hypothetical protein
MVEMKNGNSGLHNASFAEEIHSSSKYVSMDQFLSLQKKLNDVTTDLAETTQKIDAILKI